MPLQHCHLQLCAWAAAMVLIIVQQVKAPAHHVLREQSRLLAAENAAGARLRKQVYSVYPIADYVPVE